ncbi:MULTISPECIES: FtsB family cell division protein [Metabacillus]|uniref:Septum formation initiator family protein n=1 Tax=Metabacillus hrfriensis TaxID=3048891 RepID=A0ACD4RCP1_9BACI|nr:MULTISPECIES: septum formation initiator family protein [Metabacillus]UAL52389.1 septum formation initiator family protein [Metabacillus dongyingensis]USK28699.1 septum formation initiator family protein [Bacillus sp. CMF21]WHZ57917.1 septum formation initiator family protein [Metabacillus sp. CT-WN-B3]
MSLAKDRKITQLQSQYMQQQERKDQILKRRKRGLIRRLTLFGLIAAVTSVIVLTTLISQSSAINEKVHQKKELQTQLTELQKDEKVLEEEIVKLNDDEYIAKIARRDYFLSEDNEIIFTLPKKDKE